MVPEDNADLPGGSFEEYLRQQGAKNLGVPYEESGEPEEIDLEDFDPDLLKIDSRLPAVAGGEGQLEFFQGLINDKLTEAQGELERAETQLKSRTTAAEAEVERLEGQLVPVRRQVEELEDDLKTVDAQLKKARQDEKALLGEIEQRRKKIRTFTRAFQRQRQRLIEDYHRWLEGKKAEYRQSLEVDDVEDDESDTVVIGRGRRRPASDGRTGPTARRSRPPVYDESPTDDVDDLEDLYAPGAPAAEASAAPGIRRQPRARRAPRTDTTALVPTGTGGIRRESPQQLSGRKLAMLGVSMAAVAGVAILYTQNGSGSHSWPAAVKAIQGDLNKACQDPKVGSPGVNYACDGQHRRMVLIIAYDTTRADSGYKNDLGRVGAGGINQAVADQAAGAGVNAPSYKTKTVDNLKVLAYELNLYTADLVKTNLKRYQGTPTATSYTREGWPALVYDLTHLWRPKASTQELDDAAYLFWKSTADGFDTSDQRVKSILSQLLTSHPA